MLNFIFGFDSRRAEEATYLFTLTHFVTIIAVILLSIGLYKVLPVKTKKSIFITKISFIAIMVLLELARIFWRFGLHLSYGYPAYTFDWIWHFSFVVCAVQVWITVAVLFGTFCVRSNNKILVLSKNTLLGTAAIGGILSFIAPVHWNTSRYFFHFINVQTNIQHYMLMVVPLYLIKTGELKVRFKNVWMGAFGFLAVASIVIFVSHLTGRNFSTVLGDDTLEGLAPFPHYLPLKFFVPFSITLVIYFAYELYYRVQNKDLVLLEKNTLTKQEKTYGVIWIIAAAFTLFAIIYGPMLMGADINATFGGNGSLGGYDRALNSWIAIFIFIPIIGLSVLTYYFSMKLEESND